MRTVEIVKVETEEQKSFTKEFAKTYDHRVSDYDLTLPMFLVFDKETKTPVGMFQIVFAPTAFTSWCPDIKAHHLSELMTYCQGWAEMNGKLHNSPSGFIATPTKIGNFTPEWMERIGFRRMGMELYSPDKLAE